VVGVCNILIGVMILVISPYSGSLVAAAMNLSIGGGLVVIGGLLTWLGRPGKVSQEEIQ